MLPVVGPLSQRTVGHLRLECAIPGVTSRSSGIAAPSRHQQRRAGERATLRVSSPTLADAGVEETRSAPSIESVAYERGTYSVEGRLASAAPPQLVYDVLTDYANLEHVFHNVEQTHVRVSAGGEKHLEQTVSWCFLIFCGSFVTELAVQELPAARQLSFSLLHSAFMRQFVGSWDIRDAPGGGSDIRHSLAIMPVVSPPQRIGDITKSIFVSQVKGILGDLEVELSRRMREGAEETNGGGSGGARRDEPAAAGL